jgi:hypothetical protein
MRKLLLCVVAVFQLILAGCASVIPSPVALPDGNTIGDYFKTFEGNFPASASPADILFVGVAYVDNHCETFFDAVEQMQQRTSFTQRAVAVGSAQSVVLLTKVAETSTRAITAIAVGTTIADALFEEFRKQYLFAPHSSAVRRMVQVASEKQARDIRIVSSQATFTRAAAIYAVQTYARNCTLANIMSLYRLAIEKGADRIAADGAPIAPIGATPSSTRESVGEVRQRAGGATGGTGLLGINRYVVR